MTTDVLGIVDHAALCADTVGRLLERTEDVGEIAPEGALAFWTAARNLSALAADVARVAETMLIEAVGGKTGAYLVADKSVAVRRSYKRSEWEHSKLATHIALRALGGEMVPGMDEVIHAWLTACRPEWRVTVLAEMGLDEESYCSKELGRATASVVG